MAQGNPNPSPATRFGGERENPKGKTAAQRAMEIENAERATRIRSKLLEAVETAMHQGASLDMVEAAMLKLIKDSEDRGFGAPSQPMANDPDNPLPMCIPVTFVSAKGGD